MKKKKTKCIKILKYFTISNFMKFSNTSLYNVQPNASFTIADKKPYEQYYCSIFRAVPKRFPWECYGGCLCGVFLRLERLLPSPELTQKVKRGPTAATYYEGMGPTDLDEGAAVTGLEVVEVTGCGKLMKEIID